MPRGFRAASLLFAHFLLNPSALIREDIETALGFRGGDALHQPLRGEGGEMPGHLAKAELGGRPAVEFPSELLRTGGLVSQLADDGPPLPAPLHPTITLP